jgi:quercetin dioxygenase-like cupin family protein
MFKGKQTVRYKDHEEVFEAGDAFYMPPGHSPAAVAGSEFVIMSPADELAVTQAAMYKNAQAMRPPPR